MTLTDVIDAYVLLQQSLGKRFESARTLLRRFSREVGNPHIQEVEAADLATFLRGSGPLSATWTLKYRVLTGFYRFAITRGYVDSSPLPTSQPKLPPQQSPYVYSTDEIRRLLDATSALRVANIRLKAMYRTLLMLLYGGGLRVGEALSLTLRDVDLTERIITVRNTKFFKTRMVPIGPKLSLELAAHVTTIHDPHGQAVVLPTCRQAVPACSTGGGDRLPRRRESSATPARSTSHCRRAPGCGVVSYWAGCPTAPAAIGNLPRPRRSQVHSALSANDAGTPPGGEPPLCRLLAMGEPS